MEQIISINLKALGLSTILIIFVCLLFKKIFNSFWNDIWEQCKNIRFGTYEWKPVKELKNNDVFENISNFPKDIKIDLKNFDIKLNTQTKDLDIISGQDSFKQSLITYIHTERERNLLTGKEYGNEHSHSIFIAKNYCEYCRQCQYLAENILNHETFKKYIQQIYSICRKKDKLIIEMKVYGKADTMVCVIPMYRDKKEHERRLKNITGTK